LTKLPCLNSFSWCC